MPPLSGSHPAAALATWDGFVDLLENGNFDAAAKMADQALDAGDDEGAWRLGKAWVLMGQGHLDQALAAAQDAALAGVDEALASRTLATLYLRLGRLEEAREAAEYAYHLDDDDASHRLLVAVQEAERRAAPRALFPDQTVQMKVVSPPQPAVALDRTHPVSVHVPARTPATTSAPAFSPSTLAAARAAPSTRLRLSTPGAVHLPDAQLEALYGSTLFGRWEALVAPSPVPGWTRYMRPGVTARVGALVVLAALAAVGIVSVGQLALDRQKKRLAEHAVERINVLLHAGTVEQLAAFLDESEVATPDSTSELGRLSARAQATVYRLQDADLRRLALVQGSPPKDEAGYDAVVTAAMLLPLCERTAKIGELRRADRSQTKDGQAAYLAATAALRADDLDTAANAVARALALEPSNLMAIEAAAEIDARRGQLPRAVARLAEMRDISPWSLWPSVLGQRLTVLYGAAADATPAAKKDAAPSPVKVSERALLSALAAHRRHDADAAAAGLKTAVAAISGQPVFLVDHADLLLEAGALGLVEQLLAVPTWPRESVAAASVEGRLLAARDRKDDALPKLAAVWKTGVRDPRVARALVDLVAVDPRLGLDARSVLTETLDAWPNRLDLEVRLAEMLLADGKAAAVIERLRARMLQPGAAANRPLAARAYLMLAQAENAGANRGEAMRWARRAVHVAPALNAAATLLRDLKEAERKANALSRSKRRGTRR
ncbi:MAG: hypothetical protein HY903_02965 [Deltaproteobacteria bacterium]|nr:hypothetical protein [Deltaproteobacteria bacterium]